MRSILVFAAIVLHLTNGAPLANNYVENPDEASNGTVYSISHLFPKVFMKTEEFTINHEMCIQFSYKLMERKVKLRAYTCRLSEGGFCTTDSYSYPTDQKDCDYLRPWSWTEDKWGFYFVLERRPRRFGSRAKSRRISKRQDSRPVGQIQIDGLIPCKNVCNRYKRKKY